MNILADLHHSGLYYSLHLLLEKRLGHKLFRPIGMDWFERGFWKIAEPYNNDTGTIRQYLLLDSRYRPIDGSPPLNQIHKNDMKKKGVFSEYYEINDLAHGFVEKALTFAQFKDMDIDLIIASIPSHWIVYTKLRDEYKPNAKVICQMGNMFDECVPLMRNGTIRNLMSATIDFPVDEKVNSVFYHEEIPVVKFVPPTYPNNQINSFVHCLPKRETFEELQKLLPGYKLRAYGGGCPDGWINGLSDVYRRMQESLFVYHVKPRGDGFGWVWHSAFMNGRPVITDFSDYKDKLGGKLFIDGVTGIDIHNRPLAEVAALVNYYSDPQRHLEMCRAARNKFEEVVNYKNEKEEIVKFLQRLI